MPLLRKFIGRRSGGKVFVLGLDGLPFSFLEKAFVEGLMPNMKTLAAGGLFSPMTSVIPTVSSVAWSTYMTGKNPGKHGIYGFIDRISNSYEIFVPTSLNMTSRTLWEILGENGLQVIVINVPVTYPPREVRGILVAGFLCTNFEKLSFPPRIGEFLKSFGYRIDIDAKQARLSRDDLLEDAYLTLEKRFGAAYHLMDKYPWDFFQLHVMETDRINHFLWADWERGGPYRQALLNFYGRLDEYVGELASRLPEEVCFVILSDHGFCALDKEVYLNRFLRDSGFLDIPEGEGLERMQHESRAYSLLPGRIYVNLKGREPRGSVDPADYQSLREEISRSLLKLTDPEEGRTVIKEVIPGERIYSNESWSGFPVGAVKGTEVYPPDLVAVPVEGYDLKGQARGGGIFCRTELIGMHTYNDAMVIVRGQRRSLSEVPSIADLMPTILKWMGVRDPGDLDGRPLNI